MRLHDENASFRFNQKGLRKFLGDLEVEIMELVWAKANPTVTVRDIHDLLQKKREIAYTTVMTTMARLAEKGILKIVDKAGLANCYAPAQSREEFVTGLISRILALFFEEFPKECANYISASGNSPSVRRKKK